MPIIQFVDLVFKQLIQPYRISTPWLFHSFLLRKTKICWPSTEDGSSVLLLRYGSSILLNLKDEELHQLGRTWLNWNCLCTEFWAPTSLMWANCKFDETSDIVQPTCMAAMFRVCLWYGSRLSEENYCCLTEAMRSLVILVFIHCSWSNILHYWIVWYWYSGVGNCE